MNFYLRTIVGRESTTRDEWIKTIRMRYSATTVEKFSKRRMMWVILRVGTDYSTTLSVLTQVISFDIQNK